MGRTRLQAGHLGPACCPKEGGTCFWLNRRPERSPFASRDLRASTGSPSNHKVIDPEVSTRADHRQAPSRWDRPCPVLPRYDVFDMEWNERRGDAACGIRQCKHHRPAVETSASLGRCLNGPSAATRLYGLAIPSRRGVREASRSHPWRQGLGQRLQQSHPDSSRRAHGPRGCSTALYCPMTICT